MREILFRGKREYDSEWAYGSLHIEYGKAARAAGRRMKMRFNSYSDKGRTLMVKFECQRCGAYKNEPLEEVCKRSPDSYDYLHNLSVPKDWSDNFYGWMLCPECTKKLRDFMQMKDGI